MGADLVRGLNEPFRASRSTPGRLIVSSAVIPYPPSDRGPKPISALTVASAGTFTPTVPETAFMAPRKQADYPAAKSFSGLAPGPPNSLGTTSLTSIEPSSERADPSRAPVAVALVL